MWPLRGTVCLVWSASQEQEKQESVCWRLQKEKRIREDGGTDTKSRVTDYTESSLLRRKLSLLEGVPEGYRATGVEKHFWTNQGTYWSVAWVKQKCLQVSHRWKSMEKAHQGLSIWEASSLPKQTTGVLTLLTGQVIEKRGKLADAFSFSFVNNYRSGRFGASTI